MSLLLSVCCMALLITGIHVYYTEGKSTLSEAHAQSQTLWNYTLLSEHSYKRLGAGISAALLR